MPNSDLGDRRAATKPKRRVRKKAPAPNPAPSKSPNRAQNIDVRIAKGQRREELNPGGHSNADGSVTRRVTVNKGTQVKPKLVKKRVTMSEPESRALTARQHRRSARVRALDAQAATVGVDLHIANRARAHDEAGRQKVRDYAEIKAVGEATSQGKRHADAELGAAHAAAPRTLAKAAQGGKDLERKYAKVVVKAAKTGRGMTPEYRTSLLEAATHEAEKAKAASSVEHRSLASNALHEVKDTVTNAPRIVVEGLKVAKEVAGLKTYAKQAAQHAVGVRKKNADKPHIESIRTYAKGVVASAPVQAAQAAELAVVGDSKGARKHWRAAKKDARAHPVGTVLTVVPGLGAASKGVQGASRAVSAAREVGGVATRAERTAIRTGVRKRRAAAIARPHKVVTKHGRRNGSTATLKLKRDRARAGQQHKGNENVLAVKAQRYSNNPTVRAAQKARENAKARKGIDPTVATGRKAKRMVRVKGQHNLAVSQSASQSARGQVEARHSDASRGTKRKGILPGSMRRIEKRMNKGDGAIVINEHFRGQLASPEVRARRMKAVRAEGDAQLIAALERIHADVPKHLTPQVRERVREMIRISREQDTRRDTMQNLGGETSERRLRLQHKADQGLIKYHEEGATIQVPGSPKRVRRTFTMKAKPATGTKTAARKPPPAPDHHATITQMVMDHREREAAVKARSVEPSVKAKEAPLSESKLDTPVMDRTLHPAELEDAAWRREQIRKGRKDVRITAQERALLDAAEVKGKPITPRRNKDIRQAVEEDVKDTTHIDPHQEDTGAGGPALKGGHVAHPGPITKGEARRVIEHHRAERRAQIDAEVAAKSAPVGTGKTTPVHVITTKSEREHAIVLRKIHAEKNVRKAISRRELALIRRKEALDSPSVKGSVRDPAAEAAERVAINEERARLLQRRKRSEARTAEFKSQAAAHEAFREANGRAVDPENPIAMKIHLHPDAMKPPVRTVRPAREASIGERTASRKLRAEERRQAGFAKQTAAIDRRLAVLSKRKGGLGGDGMVEAAQLTEERARIVAAHGKSVEARTQAQRDLALHAARGDAKAADAIATAHARTATRDGGEQATGVPAAPTTPTGRASGPEAAPTKQERFAAQAGAYKADAELKRLDELHAAVDTARGAPVKVQPKRSAEQLRADAEVKAAADFAASRDARAASKQNEVAVAAARKARTEGTATVAQLKLLETPVPKRAVSAPRRVRKHWMVKAKEPSRTAGGTVTAHEAGFYDLAGKRVKADELPAVPHVGYWRQGQDVAKPNDTLGLRDVPDATYKGQEAFKTPDRSVAEHQSELEGSIGTARVRHAVMQDSQHVERAPVKETKMETRMRAERRAIQRSDKTGIRFTVVEDTGSPTGLSVMPKDHAKVFEALKADRGRLGKAIDYGNRKFVRAVLPLSPAWHAGNVADLMVRSALMGAKPGDRALGELLQKVAREHGGDEWARNAFDSVGGAHFSTMSENYAKAQPLSEFTAQRTRYVSENIDRLLGAGRSMEAHQVKSVQGMVARQMGKDLGHAVNDHLALVNRMKKDPALVDEFQRRTLEIVGDYLHHPAAFGKDWRVAAPFAQWIKASTKFVYHTLPVKHPLKTAMMFLAASATEKQRRELGLSLYIGDADAKKMGLPPLKHGYLAGAIPFAEGKSIPLGPFTSFSAAGSLLDQPVSLVNSIVPWANKPLGTLAGFPEKGAGSKKSLLETTARRGVSAATNALGGQGEKTYRLKNGNTIRRKPLSSALDTLKDGSKGLVPGAGAGDRTYREGNAPQLHADKTDVHFDSLQSAIRAALLPVMPAKDYPLPYDFNAYLDPKTGHVIAQVPDEGKSTGRGGMTIYDVGPVSTLEGRIAKVPRSKDKNFASEHLPTKRGRAGKVYGATAPTE